MATDPQTQIAQLQAEVVDLHRQVELLTRRCSEFQAGLRQAQAYIASLPDSTPGKAVELGLINGALAYAGV